MKRSREAIITEILEVCEEGATKTRKVYQVNLNFHTVIPYLDLLIKKNLVERSDESSNIYKTTSTGIKLLRELKSIQSHIPEIYDSDSGKHSGLVLG